MNISWHERMSLFTVLFIYVWYLFNFFIVIIFWDIYCLIYKSLIREKYMIVSLLCANDYEIHSFTSSYLNGIVLDMVDLLSTILQKSGYQHMLLTTEAIEKAGGCGWSCYQFSKQFTSYFFETIVDTSFRVYLVGRLEKWD